ncbi:DEAD/DEAH box helicase [Curtobacterium sp. MCLR17_042]|uniref:DEAD/DEAH box helicase n=1 Tax=Curtobacterium sp. MCLR17_042 TaxID=2175626 RepID=UPI000DA903AA|nr:DEAD/DEAH box helicase family protein [Curtobacterium sp. MCLR17_042]PZE23945.1 hypothetical protein DEJ02_16565 [Curtobacterium sp. MCLR17_042]
MLTYDPALIERIAAAFRLREPNKRALARIISSMDGRETGRELVADIATGVGKTFLMAALVEYASEQGCKNILIVTPGRVVQSKTEDNFRPGSRRFVQGAERVPVVLTPSTYNAQGADLADTERTHVFIFNIHQLLSSREGVNLGTRKIQEEFGASLYEYLQNAPDLLVLADEHHLYHSKAKAFNAAIRELGAQYVVGLTATPEPADREKIVFEYTLGDAIADGFVKRPVIVYRPNGTSSERLQLLDAVDVLRAKEVAYAAESAARGQSTRPVIFIVASSINHANDVGSLLAGPDFFGEREAILVVTSESSQEDLEALEAVEDVESPIRAIVSVNKLREGWDVSNIAVLVALRKLASQALTEQVMGRGLRLPFGERTGRAMVDSLDIVAHDSYRALLAQKDLLAARTLRDRPIGQDQSVDPQGYAVVPASVIEAVEGDTEDAEWVSAEGLSVPSRGSAGSGPSEVLTVANADGVPVIEAAELDDRTSEAGDQSTPAREIGPFWSFSFPLPRVSRDEMPFELVSIPDQVIDIAGRQHRASVEADEVKRTELTSHREADRTVIGTRDEENLKVTHKDIASRDDVVRILRQAVIDAAPEVPRTASTISRVNKMVDRYLKSAGPAEHWTRSWMERARQGIVGVIRAQTAEYKRSLKWSVDLERLEVPRRVDVVYGNEKNAHEGSEPPAPRAAVGGWYKHAMSLARFDAISTEWSIALILDKAPGIVRWLRLEQRDGVVVQGGAGFVRYFPDFIALDDNGVFWMIEGKSESSAGSDSVQSKKASANEWARRASDSELFSEEWRYMFVTESSIRASGDTWPGLKSSSEVGGE